MNNDGQAGSEAAKDIFKTRLTSDEKKTRTVARRIAFHTLALIGIAASLLSLYWWYLWFITVRICVRTYVLQQQDSILLTPGEANSWQKLFSGLDISSFSALILACFFTRLAHFGIKNTLWRKYKDGVAYMDHAYLSVLFPPQFEAVYIRFGLLGTLLSFLLAAVSQMSHLETSVSATRGSVLEQRVEEIVKDTQPHADGTSLDAPGTNNTSVNRGRQISTGQLSGKVFLLLCASLVSTFVGTFVSYVLIPPLNRLNDCAVGMLQRSPIDEEATADEFLRQLDRTSRRLGDFEKATSSLTAAANNVQCFEASAQEASEKLDDMLKLLDRTTALFQTSNDKMEFTGKKLSKTESQNNHILKNIAQFSEKLEQPLGLMSSAAARIEKASIAENHAFLELQSLSSSIKDPVALVGKFSTNMWTVLNEVRNSLQLLAKEEMNKSEVVINMADSFTTLNSALENLVEQVAVLIEQNHQDQADSTNTYEKIASIQQQIKQSASELQDLKLTTQKLQKTAGLADEDQLFALQNDKKRKHRSDNDGKPLWQCWLSRLPFFGRKQLRSLDTLDEIQSRPSFSEDEQT